jgi:signal transduction histidine kinase
MIKNYSAKNIPNKEHIEYNQLVMTKSTVNGPTGIKPTPNTDNAPSADDYGALKRQNVLLEERVERLENYVKQLAHDLKTPLTPLIGASDLLASNFNEKPWADLASSIKISAENLLRMVDEILDLELCDHGKLILNCFSFDPAEPVQETVEKLEAEIPHVRATMTVNLPSVPHRIWADETRLRQVITIFVLNAIRFTPGAGKVIVTIKPLGSITKFSVEDTGIGIAPEILPHIFEPSRAQDKQHPRSGSNGLALAKRLIELHHGHIGAESSESCNTFWFELPIDKSPKKKGAL